MEGSQGRRGWEGSAWWMQTGRKQPCRRLVNLEWRTGGGVAEGEAGLVSRGENPFLENLP